MSKDPQCPNTECPMQLRRSDDTGIQAVLQAIGALERSTAANAAEVNQRLGRMESGLARAASRVERHSGEIEALQNESKSRISSKWVLVSAFIGAGTTLAATLFKGGK